MLCPAQDVWEVSAAAERYSRLRMEQRGERRGGNITPCADIKERVTESGTVLLLDGSLLSSDRSVFEHLRKIATPCCQRTVTESELPYGSSSRQLFRRSGQPKKKSTSAVAERLSQD